MRSSIRGLGLGGRGRAAFLSVLLSLAAAAGAHAHPGQVGDGRGFRPAERGRRLDFPADHFAHLDTRLEWWYVTALLAETEGGRPTLGVQFTVFRLGLRPGRARGASAWRAHHVLLGHAALTDLENGRHRFAETFARSAPLWVTLGAPGSGGVVVEMPAPPGGAGVFALRLRDGRFEVRADAAAEGFGFALALEPTRPPLLHGEDGFSPKDPAGRTASHYASHARLRAEGQVFLDGEPRGVTGFAWFDHEFGDGRLADDQVGWDWAGLRMHDGADLMVYRMRRADGSTAYVSGTLRLPDGAVERLDARRLRVEALGAAGGFPRALRVVLDGRSILVEPFVENCVNESRLVRDLRYLEAPARATIDGREVGVGYLEGAGYGGARVGLGGS